VSRNVRYAAVLQNDGNWVLCPAAGSPPTPDLARPLWSAFGEGAGDGHSVGGHAAPPFVAVMPRDGNFVLYNGRHPDLQDRRPHWSANTQQPQPNLCVAVIKDDGTFAVLPGDDPYAAVAPRWANGVVTDVKNIVCRVVSGAGQAVSSNHTWVKFPNPVVIKVTTQNFTPVQGGRVEVRLTLNDPYTAMAFADPAVETFYAESSRDGIALLTDKDGIVRVSLWGRATYTEGDGRVEPFGVNAAYPPPRGANVSEPEWPDIRGSSTSFSVKLRKVT
jgi:hypothetical protein